MLDYMEKHPEVAHNKYVNVNKSTNVRDLYRQQWQELADALNGLGQKKSLAQWQSSWSDWKVIVKKRWRIKKEEMEKSCEGVCSTNRFTRYEKRILPLIGLPIFENFETPLEIEPGSSRSLESLEAHPLPVKMEQSESSLQEELKNQPETGLQISFENDPLFLTDEEPEVQPKNKQKIDMIEHYYRNLEIQNQIFLQINRNLVDINESIKDNQKTSKLLVAEIKGSLKENKESTKLLVQAINHQTTALRQITSILKDK